MRPTQCHLIAAALVVCCGAASLCGCSSGTPLGEVSGKVTFKGQPVKEGTVTFLNLKEGGAAEALIGSDGGYAVANGVALGEYVVEIKPPVHIVDTDPGKSPPAPVEKAAPDIPKKYRMQGSSPLKVNVQAGKTKSTST
jgi:hypothetical protein